MVRQRGRGAEGQRFFLFVPLRLCVVILGALLLVACGGNGDAGEATAVPPTPTPPPTPPPDTLYVDAGRSRGPISPYVYGSNYGPWVIVPYDLLDEAETAGITFLRFPGGNWGDRNNLRPRQIDQFIELARRMGAEPSINTRLPGGSPEQSAELVAYTNVENDYDVRYWAIGNEPTLYDDYDTARFNREWRAHAEAMRAVDPDILLIGPEPHQYVAAPREDLQDEQGIDFLTAFLEANGDLVDVVSIHRYPFPTTISELPTIEDLRRNSREWDTLIPALRALVGEKTGRELPLAVTEVNSNWTKAAGGEATPDSFYNAIWWGDTLGRMIDNEVTIVAHFVLQSKTGAGGWGLLDRFEPRPTYYVYQLYQRFGSELLFAHSDDPDVRVYAARRQDGALTLMLVNLAPEARSKPLQIDGFNGSIHDTLAALYRLDPDHMAQSLPVEPLGDAITLPGQSLTLLILEPTQ